MQPQDRAAELIKGPLGDVAKPFIRAAPEIDINIGRMIARFCQRLGNLRAKIIACGLLQAFPVQVQQNIGFGDHAFSAGRGQQAAIIAARQIFIGPAQVDYTAVAHPVIKGEIIAHPHDARTRNGKGDVRQPINKDERCTS